MENILKEILLVEQLLSATNEWIDQCEENISNLQFDASNKNKVQSQVSQLQVSFFIIRNT